MHSHWSPGAWVEFSTLHGAGSQWPWAIEPKPRDVAHETIVTLAAGTWLSVGILDLAWGRCAIPNWGGPFPWNLTFEAIRTPTICAIAADAILDAVTRCRITAANGMWSTPHYSALEPILALAFQPSSFRVCHCTLCRVAISCPATVDVPLRFALKAICTTTVRTREIVRTVEIALCWVAVSCPAPVAVPVRLALKALCTTAVGTGDAVGTMEIALCWVAVSCPAAVAVPVHYALKALCTTAVGTGDTVGTVEIALCWVAISYPAVVAVPVRFALEAICTTTLGTGDTVGTAKIALRCGARALRIGAIPGDLTDKALVTSTLSAIPWIRLPTAAALRTVSTIYLPIHHLPACPPICRITYLLIYQSTYLPIYLSTYLPVYLSTYLPIYLSAYLPI